MLGCLTGDVNLVSQAINGVPVLAVNLVILVCGAIYLGWLSLSLMAGLRGVRRPRHRQLLVFLPLRQQVREAVEAGPGRPAEAGPQADRGGQRAEDAPRSAQRVRRARCSNRAKRGPREPVLGDTLHDAAIAWGRLTFFIAIGLLLFAWPRIAPRPIRHADRLHPTILYLMSPLEQIMAWLPFMAWAHEVGGADRAIGPDAGRAGRGDRPP